MRIRCLQHVPFEGPARIGDWARKRGHEITVARLFAGEPAPPPEAYDWLVVLGGPMGACDEAIHPWMGPELRSLREGIDAGRTVIGVCLGAQLIARALGGVVSRGPAPEIGWWPVEETEAAASTPLAGFLDGQSTVMQWHGDTFTIPDGAVHLARSPAVENQAFLWGGRVLALQFHLETTPDAAAALIDACRGEMVAGEPWVQTAEAMLADPDRFERIGERLERLLDRMASGDPGQETTGRPLSEI